MPASKKDSNIASNFCNPWKRRFPSVVFKSNATSFDPTASCRKIDARTIGPIPAVISEPVLLPSNISSRSNCWMRDGSTPMG